MNSRPRFWGPGMMDFWFTTAGRPIIDFHSRSISVENERTVCLSGLLGRVGSKAIYTYDFGDSWEHSIVLEKRLPVDPNTTYPVCTDGQLACPPEDCGGIPGFYDLVEALHDPNHERHEEMLDWIGDDFDPQAFSVDKVNRMLAPLSRRRRKTSQG